MKKIQGDAMRGDQECCRRFRRNSGFQGGFRLLKRLPRGFLRTSETSKISSERERELFSEVFQSISGSFRRFQGAFLGALGRMGFSGTSRARKASGILRITSETSQKAFNVFQDVSGGFPEDSWAFMRVSGILQREIKAFQWILECFRELQYNFREEYEGLRGFQKHFGALLCVTRDFKGIQWASDEFKGRHRGSQGIFKGDFQGVTRCFGRFQSLSFEGLQLSLRKSTGASVKFQRFLICLKASQNVSMRF